jgi:deoxyadenosine/deoxycytidine kinase
MEKKKSEVLNYLNKHKVLLYLEGLIGSGKSTLLKSIDKWLSDETNKVGGTGRIRFRWYSEPIKQKLLDLFYSDIPKYAFSFQSIVIRERVQVINEAKRNFNCDNFFQAIDRSRWGDCAFALMHRKSGNISPVEYEVYVDLISDEPKDHGEPGNREDHGDRESEFVECLVYLKNTPKISRKRIVKRGNQKEIDGCTVEYLTELEESYMKVLEVSEASEIERLSIDKIKNNFDGNIIILDYNEELKVTEDGYITEEDTFNILHKIIKSLPETKM